MYNNYYTPQANIDRINSQIAELERIRNQIQQPQPTNLTQNFQLAPTSRDSIRYASSMDEVQKDTVVGETPFFSRDMSVVWIKDSKGNIRTYELNEIVAKDDKDIKIEFLMAQIEDLKKGLKRNEYTTNTYESIKNEEPSNFSTISKSTKKSK